MATNWNVFAIGRRKHDEDQLTEMLAWLVARVPQVGHALITLAFNADLGAADFTCTTQPGINVGRLDALLSGSEFVLVVESKIDSDFGPDQIRKYLDWLEDVHGENPRPGLMTLTKRPLTAKQLAELTGRKKVVGSAHLWEEFHERLVDVRAVDELQGELVGEFLEMLEEEGLIPVKPFDPDNELTIWREAWKTVERFHTFFNASKAEVAKKLDASPIPNSKSDSAAGIWQDFQSADGARFAVGLDGSDEMWRSRGAALNAPVLWIAAADSCSASWAEVADAMEKQPPVGWLSTAERAWGRPCIWRLLHETIGTGPFDEQRLRLADACAVARSWIADAQHSVEHP
jgi:hypothetical protein